MAIEIRRHGGDPVTVDREQEARQAARIAGLTYVNDLAPGIRRRRRGKGWAFSAPDGRPIRERATIRRIEAVAIPPAWTDVWICPFEAGHIQATGRDAKGRKQYRYHQRWREVRDENKYGRMVAFGEALPRLRRRLEADLRLEGLPREKVVATVIRLLDKSFIRIGNLEYARDNESFGLTTMREEHVEVEGSRIRFKFRGKSGKEHEIDVRDRRLARILEQCQDLPGQELFRYEEDDGSHGAVDSRDVNEYLREATGNDFTAKDFRTWAGTVLCARELASLGEPTSESDARKRLVMAVKAVASNLGNTEAVCRKSYIHPVIVESYLDGSLLACMEGNFAGGGETCVLQLLREKASGL